MTLFIALALLRASVMPIQHFVANLIEHKQEKVVAVVGKQMRYMKDQGKIAAFILTPVASERRCGALQAINYLGICFWKIIFSGALYLLSVSPVLLQL